MLCDAESRRRNPIPPRIRENREGHILSYLAIQCHHSKLDFFFLSLGPPLLHMEVHRLGVESELPLRPMSQLAAMSKARD